MTVIRRAGALFAVALALAACSRGADVSVDTTTGASSTAAPSTSSGTSAATTTVATTSPPRTTAPRPIVTTTVPSTLEPLQPPLAWADAAPYTGVVALTINGRLCTGTVVDTGVDSGPANVVTAGHCTEALLLGQNDVLVDRTQVEGTARFPRQPDGPPQVFELPIASVRYATMKHVDVAVIELKDTLGDVKATGYRPMPFATTPPQAGDRVVNVGVPADGVDPIDQVLRRGDCTLAAPTLVVEEIWQWQAYPNDCPGLRKGSSGSPVARDGSLVGIINTVAPSVVDPDVSCSLDHPCEVHGDDVFVNKGKGYAIDVSGVRACFGADGRFSQAAPGCPLEPPTVVQVQTVPRSASAGTGQWSVEIRGANAVKVKQGTAGTTSCTSADGYGASQPVGERLVIENAVPAHPGIEVTCVLPDGVDPSRALSSVLIVEPIGP
jgi:hypothetical protein